MKRLAILALSLALVAASGSAQDSGSGDKEKQEPPPTPAQLEEMKKSLEAQQKQIEKLRQEAAERKKALEEMQKQVQEQQEKVQDQLKEAEAAAQAAAAAAAHATEAAKTQPVRQAPEDMNLQPATADQPGLYNASVAKSVDASLQQPNPVTQAVTPPWAILRIGDNVTFRFGTLIQPTYEALQDPNSTGYSQNLYLRRARFNVLANLPENITVFFQTDDIRVGYSGANGQKAINTGFQLLDGWAQWNFLGHAMAIQAGFFLVPSDRQIMMSAGTFLALDLMTWPTQMQTILEESGGRDYGVGFNGALLNDHLTYRAGVYEGYRAPTSPQEPPLGPAAGSRNSLLFAGRVEYNVFDPQVVYAYTGTSLGKKKYLAFAGWWQAQNNYKGYGGDIFWDWPVRDGDAVTFEADYVHYDGHGQVFDDNGTNNTLPKQDTFYTNAGYYFCHAKIQPFARYEFLHYADPVNLAKEQYRIGGGFNYYVFGQNFKIVPYYERVFPKVQPTTAQIQNFNRFVVEFQGFF
jgi:hypothetical protein